MKWPSLILVSFWCLCSSAGWGAAEPTAPVDPSQRNEAFAPSATINPDRVPVLRDANVQEKRVEKNTIEKPAAAMGDRRAPIDVQEAREKNVREKVSHQPERTEPAMSSFNHRDAAISTSAAISKPAMVAKYQNSLTSASESNMARFPANGGVTTSKINRFVFKKNPPEAPALTGEPAVTPAGGGGKVLK